MGLPTMTTNLPLSWIVNVQLNVQPLAPSRRNFGLIVLLTPEVQPFTDQGSRWLLYSSAQALGTDFGVDSETYAAAQPFFAQSPRPKTILCARWDATETDVPATAASLMGRPVTTTLAEFQAMTEAEFSLPINGVSKAYTGIDLSVATSYDTVAGTISAALDADGVQCRYDPTGTRFIIESKTAGASIQLGFVTGSGADYVGTMLGLDNVSPTFIINGTDAATIPAETIPEALQLLSTAYSDWYAAVVVKSPLTDAEIQQTADYIMAAERKLFGVTTLDSRHLTQLSTNVFKTLYDQQAYRVAAQFDTNDRYAIVSFLARALSVNFAGSKTTLTMKFKQQPGVTPEAITETQAKMATALGINYYAYFDTVPMVAEGTVIAGRFFDEVHILDWFCDAVQKNVFAVLYQSPTKVPLTDAGTHRLIAAIEAACKEGVKNGSFAPGVWNGDPFGNLETGDYLDEGFYIYADSVDTLSVDDRQARRAPPIQVAVKMAGAIHEVDVIINFDR
jgi:hypothetical protein